MKDFMSWHVCEKTWIKQVEVDPSQIKSLTETASARLKDTQQRKVTKENVSFIVESYYEVIKELLTALLLSKGLRSRNHQCLISFFYHQFKEYEAEAHVILHLNFVRNRLNYYGEKVDFEYFSSHKEKFEKIVKILQSLLA